MTDPTQPPSHPTESAGERSATLLDEYLNGQEFHELCMDYRGAMLANAQGCYERLQDSIRTQFAAARQRIEGLEAERNAAVDECRAETERKDKAMATCRHYESALYYPGIGNTAVRDGNTALEITPERVAEIIKRATAAESRLAEVRLATIEECAKVCDALGQQFKDDRQKFIENRVDVAVPLPMWVDCAAAIRHLKESKEKS